MLFEDFSFFIKVTKTKFMNVTDLEISDTLNIFDVMEDLETFDTDSKYVLVYEYGMNTQRVYPVSKESLLHVLGLTDNQAKDLSDMDLARRFQQVLDAQYSKNAPVRIMETMNGYLARENKQRVGTSVLNVITTMGPDGQMGFGGV